MRQTLGLVSLMVDDYDTAIAHYTGALGFELLEDTDRGSGKRWVRVAPRGGGGTGLLLAKASDDAQRARVGDQHGLGRVGFFCRPTISGATPAMKSRGSCSRKCARGELCHGSRIRDLYGNGWDLCKPVLVGHAHETVLASSNHGKWRNCVACWPATDRLSRK